MAFDRKDIDAAAKGNDALRSILDRLNSAQGRLFRVLGITPDQVKANAQPDKFAPPPVASFVVTGSGGVFQILITPPKEVLVPLLLHHVQSSQTLPFEVSSTVVDYGETSQSVVTVLAANQTVYWRIRSRFPMGIPNGWTVYQGTPTGTILLSTTAGAGATPTAVSSGTSGGGTTVSANVLLKNTTAQGRLAPTGTATALVTIPSVAQPAAIGTFRNEGTAGNWLVCFGGLIPTSTFYHAKLGPGDPLLLTLGEAYTEENPPTGAITAVHDSPGATGAGVLAWYAGWNNGSSPLTGPTGPRGPYGGAITLDYSFASATANADPGAGTFRLNNATENTATALYINTTSFDGVSAAGILDALLTNTTTLATLRIVSKTDVTKFLLFSIVSKTTHTGYREYALTVLASSAASPFTAGDECLLCVGYVGNAYPRQTTTLITGSLGPAASETGTVALAKTFAIGKVVASDFCRIRLYSTAAARTADASRSSAIQPSINTQHGVIVDLVLDTADKLTWIMSPLAYGANLEDTTANISYSITNLSSNTEALTITFTWTSEEF